MKEVIFVCSHRPKTKELLELFLFFLLFTIWFISSLKEIQVKKILPDQESNRGPSAPQQSTFLNTKAGSSSANYW